jgi:hypothetical protein
LPVVTGTAEIVVTSGASISESALARPELDQARETTRGLARRVADPIPLRSGAHVEHVFSALTAESCSDRSRRHFTVAGAAEVVIAPLQTPEPANVVASSRALNSQNTAPREPRVAPPWSLRSKAELGQARLTGGAPRKTVPGSLPRAAHLEEGGKLRDSVDVITQSPRREEREKREEGEDKACFSESLVFFGVGEPKRDEY